MGKLKPRLVISVLLILALPAYCQNMDLKSLLSNRTLPLTLKPQELSANWWRIAISQSADIAPEIQRMLGQAGVGPQNNIYFTQGQTVTVGNDTYIVAYRPREDPAEARLGRARRFDPQDNPPPDKLAPNATLTLSLLNLRSIGSLSNIRPFDPGQDIEKEADRQARLQNESNQASVRNLRQLGLALMQYTQDYDEKFPPMISAQSMREIRQPVPARSPGTVQQVLMPYARNAEIFVHPFTREIYRPNRSLSRKSLAAIESPAEMVSFYEASPAPDGKRAVAFVDGHVRRVPETEWPLIKKQSGIPP